MVQENSLKKIIIIGGPTASGKSDLSVKCAQELNGEIISCDSMQIYERLNIGTGKLSLQDRRAIRHFMIDIVPPDGNFSVSDYVSACDKIIDNIIQRNKVPILVGGTGFYINGLINGFNYGQAAKDCSIRNKYEKILNEKGKEYLYSLLQEVDKQSCLKINLNDTKRVIRALEIYELTGKPKSDIIQKAQIKRYDYKLIILSPERKTLYKKINKRVDSMITQGLLDEVKSLYEFKDCQSMQAIGYKELIDCLDHKVNLTEAVETIKKNSRHYAKRQLTYFKHIDAESNFINDYNSDMDNEIIKSLREFLND